MTAHNSIASNAFNSTSFVSNGVDSRTGLYTVTINLPEINGNQLSGPALPLGLSFSPINTQDSGFGTGWDLSLTQFNPATRVLSLASGETYKVTGSGPTPEIAEFKLDSFKFFDEGAGRYRVVHKSGLVEVLELRGISGHVLALPVQIQSAEGRGLWLSYLPYGNSQLLHEVRQADNGLLLRLARIGSTMNIQYLAGAADQVLATYLLQFNSGTLRQMILPTPDNARWSFEYQVIGNYTCLKGLRTPQGATESIEHDGRHLFPNINRAGVPRVTKHVVDPGRDQPSVESRYTYSTHNFLGHGAASLTWRDDGLDNLYRVTEAYEYSTTQTRWKDGVAGRTVVSTFNRYHLLTQQVTTQGNARLINTIEYHLNDRLPFDLQVPQCQLPFKTRTRWTLVDDPTRLRDEVEITRFDAYGNKVEHIDTSGIRQTWTYYPAIGESGCPPDPYGFCRQPKEHRHYPAKQARQATAAHGRLIPARMTEVKRNRPTPVFDDEPLLITRFTYSSHPGLTGGPVPTLVLDTSVSSAETAAGEHVLLTSSHSYHDCPDIPERHGKPHITRTQRSGHVSTLTQEYDYTARPGSLTHKQMVSHDLDGTTSQSQQSFELYTGLLLEEHTSEGRVLRNEYDGSRRIISESVTAADSSFPATRRYSYSWPATAGRFAEHKVVDALGVETVEELDGLGRTIRRLRQKADGSADHAQLRLAYSARYGHDSELLEETEHDWLDEQPLALTRRFEYDEWDQRCREIAPNGVGFNVHVDPFDLSITRWHDGMGRTVTRNNAFGKPDSVVTYSSEPAPGQPWLSRSRSFYDGHGQLRMELGTRGGRNLYDYDVLGRLRRQQLPDRTRVEQDYAEHSEAALITRLQVRDSHRATTSTVIGSQAFDGLERVTQRTEGPRTTQLRYRGSLDVIDEHITPAQQPIAYEYDLRLGNEATATHADEVCTFEYHPITTALMAARSAQGSLEYQYDLAGQLASERSTIGVRTREVTYRTSPGGRLQQRLETIASTQVQATVEYDTYGRVQRTSEGQLRTDLHYNAQGQLSRSTTQDLQSANTLVTEIEYDSLGREILRTQQLTGSPEQVTALTWAADGRLQQREVRHAGILGLHERFIYDLRGRLIEHACSGPDLPQDAYGNPIVGQQFDFDGLDNLLFCTSYFADGSEDEARHFYAEDDPCQLRGLTHTHRDYPRETLFSYDANGNLTSDSAGRSLHYDRQGRLLQVGNDPGAPHTQYRYDAHDHLLGVTRGADGETLRFYQDTKVRSTVAGERVRSFCYAANAPVGQQRLGEPGEVLLTLCGANNSVHAELKGQGPVKRSTYTCYGDSPEGPDSDLAYTGELRERETGWYLLGKGYRAYDPQLRRFHSPDGDSPFGAGGLNPYTYCLGDPIGLRDPSGHFAQPQEQALLLRKARREAANKFATSSLLIGTAFSIVLPLVLAPVTGGLSLTGFVANLAVDTAVLVARTAVVSNLIVQGKDPEGFIRIYDNVGLGLGLLAMAGALGKGIANKASKSAAAKAGGLLGSEERFTIPRAKLNNKPLAMNPPDASALNASLIPRAKLSSSSQSAVNFDEALLGIHQSSAPHKVGISQPAGGADIDFSIYHEIPAPRDDSRLIPRAKLGQVPETVQNARDREQAVRRATTAQVH